MMGNIWKKKRIVLDTSAQAPRRRKACLWETADSHPSADLSSSLPYHQFGSVMDVTTICCPLDRLIWLVSLLVQSYKILAILESPLSATVEVMDEAPDSSAVKANNQFVKTL